MPVDPLKSGLTSQTGAGRLGPNQPARRSTPAGGAEEERAGGDTVEVSAASRTLGDGGETVPQGTVAAERLREVLRRIEAEYYGTPEVGDAIARRVRGDLGLHGTE